MASSSVSQESVDYDDRNFTRRVKIRTARTTARNFGHKDDILDYDERDKRIRSFANLKVKNTKEKRKLREKRRSAGVVHLISTESTGDSLDEDDVIEISKKNSMVNDNFVFQNVSLQYLLFNFSFYFIDPTLQTIIDSASRVAIVRTI